MIDLSKYETPIQRLPKIQSMRIVVRFDDGQEYVIFDAALSALATILFYESYNAQLNRKHHFLSEE